MTDTAQPVAAETDAFADAASAFKVELGQDETPDRPRNERGQFASTAPEEADEQEQDVPADDTADAIEEDDTDEAAEEAQPEDVPMPSSWSKEDGELWEALPAEAQAKIAEREAQRDHAVNQKFQEAANVRKTYETVAQEASNGREEALLTINQVMQLVVSDPPSISMLDPMSGDYAPDTYHMLKAQHEQSQYLLHNLASQRDNLRAQVQQEQQRMTQLRIQEVNTKSAPAFLKDVPDASDPAKLPAVFKELIDYAVEHGSPVDVFEGPLSAFEWHVLWKAKQFDRLQQAKVKVNTTPAPKKAAPPVRPGVTTPRSTVQKQGRQRDFVRLIESGSIADGAAVFKHFM